MATMTIQGELRNLEKVQSRLVRFSKYLERQGNYDDLFIKIASLVGTIEDVLEFDS